MINNINSIQNLSDLKNLKIDKDNIKDGYLIQALANLGQRIGLKGDSLTLNSFTFNDIYNSYNSDDSNKIGFIKYNYDQDLNKYYFNIGKIQKDKINNITNSNYYELLNSNSNSRYDVSNQIYFSNRFALSNGVIVNNIEYYVKNSYIEYNDNVLTCVLFGKKIGVIGEHDCDVIYFKYDLISHKFIKIDYLLFINRSKNVNGQDVYWYMLNECKYFTENNKYKLSVYTFNTEFDVSEYYVNFDKNVFRNVCTSSYIHANKNVSDIFLSTDYVNLFDIITNKDGIFYKSYINYIVSDIDLTFDEESNVLFSFDNGENDTNKIKLEKIYKYIPRDKWSINDFIKRINNDYTYIVFEIMNYFNKFKYTNSKSLLYEKLLLKLYEKINNEISNTTSSIISTTLYIPLDYKFYFVANDNDDRKLFYSLDNLVYELNLNNSLFDISSKLSNILVFDCGMSIVPKIVNYKFVIDYDNKYPDIINKINVENINTLPFIDSDNKWNVNNISTNIVAKGKSNSLSSFIVVIHDENDNTYTLNNELNSEYIENISIFGYSIYSDDNINAYLPTINDNNISQFSSTTILYVDTQTSGESTFWTPAIDENDNVTWKIIKIGDNILKISDIINVNELKDIIEYQINVGESSDTIVMCQASTIKYVNTNDTSQNHFIIQLLSGPVYMSLSRASISELSKLTIVEDEQYFNSKIILLGFPDITNASVNKQIISDIKYLDDAAKKNNDDWIFDTTRYIIFYNIQYKKIVSNVLAHTNYESSKKYVYYTYKDELIIQINETVSTQNLQTINANLLEIVMPEHVCTITKTSNKTVIKINLTELQTNVPIGYNAESFDDYTFKNDVPIIDFKEVIQQDNNLLNRANLLSIDKTGKLYNAFLGSHWNDANKDTLYLTTSKVNINIGQNTLSRKTQNEDTSFLNPFTKFVVGFNNIELAAIPGTLDQLNSNIENAPKISLNNNGEQIVTNSKLFKVNANDIELSCKNLTIKSNGDVKVINDNKTMVDGVMYNVNLPILHECNEYNDLLNVSYINDILLNDIPNNWSIYADTTLNNKYLYVQYNNTSNERINSLASPTNLAYTIVKCFNNFQVFTPFLINVFKRNLFEESITINSDNSYSSEKFVGINLFTLVRKYLKISKISEISELYFNNECVFKYSLNENNQPQIDNTIQLPTITINRDITSMSYPKIHKCQVSNAADKTELLLINYSDVFNNDTNYEYINEKLTSNDTIVNQCSIFAILNTDKLIINSSHDSAGKITISKDIDINKFRYTFTNTPISSDSSSFENQSDVPNIYDIYLNEGITLTCIKYQNKYKVFIRMNTNLLNNQEIQNLYISY